MNYRHGFHAGNFADVLKHALLVELIAALQKKPTPIAYVETHAGAGRYDLGGAEAAKTGEWRDGIGRILAADDLPAPLVRYRNVATALPRAGAADAPLSSYPGSPLVASMLLRADDRAILCERHPEEVARLRAEFASDPRVAVHGRDGYAALNALLPPTPRRGLVLIDPPFEAQEQEFRLIEEALAPALKRWPTGVYAIWYPIKRHPAIAPFHRWLKGAGLRRVLACELMVHPDNSPLRLNGCGLAIINAPYEFDRTAREMLPAMQRLLAQDRDASQRVEWLVGD